MFDAWVFTLGNEVVEGRVINTNAAYLGRRLFVMGFRVLGNLSLIDDPALVSEFIKYVLSRGPKVIVTSGGLGPTYDDRTLEAVAKAVGKGLRLNDEALKMIRSKYAGGGLTLTEERIKMAYLPEGAIPIPNPVGSAPGSWLEIGESVIISLPGVPKEMEAMWESWVEPRLRDMAPRKHVVERSFRVKGVPESSAARVVKEVLKAYSNVYVKTHPKGHEIREPVLDVYVMVSGEDELTAKRIAGEVVSRLKKGLRGLGGAVEEPE